MKVSIITIVYNNCYYIGDCIESVLSQTYDKVEHIVVDGGSVDGTRGVIDQYRDRLAAYISEPDKGLYDALNKGIRMATGDIIGVLHSDDLFYAPNTLNKVVNAFRKTNADLVYANGMYVPRDDERVVKRIYKAKPFYKHYMSFGWIPLHTTIYVKRELFDKYGLYDDSFAIASDYDISLRWFRNPEVRKQFLDEWVVKMRLGGKSTNPQLQKKKSTEDLVIIKRHELYGLFTLAFKIGRKVPQYLYPRLIRMRDEHTFKQPKRSRIRRLGKLNWERAKRSLGKLARKQVTHGARHR
ncbi:glycosyltransferase family 2 protein [Mangrovibacterium sp.]|uniref:glycosyltransferase family 2 protein n=1 Tax=Mangrovibacterium sp. TaxID=1961364 RepID=UPI003568FA1C